MNCEDLMNIPRLRDGLTLVAGKDGLRRNIRWIYFADCVQCLKDEVDIRELIYGEELVIVTNESLTGDDDKIIKMISLMLTKGIAGFVINEGQISKPVMEFCEESKLPLYELSVSLHLIDVSQIICKALVEEESSINSRERLLSTILYSEKPDTKSILQQSNHLGCDLTGKNRMVILRVNSMTDTDGNTISDEELFAGVIESLKREIDMKFRASGLRHILMLSQDRDIIFLVPSRPVDRNILSSILQDIISRGNNNYNLSVSMTAGIGDEREYLEDLRESSREAKRSLNISRFLDRDDRVYFYDDLGIYSLIAKVPDGRFLDEFMEKRIGELIKADSLQDGNLCETLETYLDHDCNANATAEAMYIHRNTLRYRMDKIEKLLGTKGISLSGYMELKLAFAIKKYRENRGSDSFVRDAQ